MERWPDAVFLLLSSLRNRGVRKGQAGDNEGALADYTAAIELEGAPADQVALASANSVSIHLAEGRLANAAMSLAVAVNSGLLPDGGLRMIGWYNGKTDELKALVEDRSAHHLERGCALAVLTAIDGQKIRDYAESWLKGEGFGEAAKVFWSISKIWKEHLNGNMR